MAGKPVSVSIYKPTINITIKEECHMERYDQPPSVYKAIGDKCGLSDRTIRNAFQQKPITWQTACRIAKHLGIMANSFRIKEDKRGQRKTKPTHGPKQ